ncbi:hypothetical protein L910_3738 [Vibrio fluvialis PG41]|uniref:Uncharacterized protein n=1 Tax=Vibrio fluvialis PG41 TaxID=1336752 RepID=S7I7A0_VIBFL|nr:hypothetical protein L910_3738 [Vibrio fluvialis PG41]
MSAQHDSLLGISGNRPLADPAHALILPSVKSPPRLRH